MIRLGLFLIGFAVCLAIVGAELYGLAWLAAHGMALATHHEAFTAGIALLSLAWNRRVVAAARRKRATWRADFLARYGGQAMEREPEVWRDRTIRRFR